MGRIRSIDRRKRRHALAGSRGSTGALAAQDRPLVAQRDDLKL
jgi:hypothetical protein